MSWDAMRDRESDYLGELQAQMKDYVNNPKADTLKKIDEKINQMLVKNPDNPFVIYRGEIFKLKRFWNEIKATFTDQGGVVKVTNDHIPGMPKVLLKLINDYGVNLIGLNNTFSHLNYKIMPFPRMPVSRDDVRFYYETSKLCFKNDVTGLRRARSHPQFDVNRLVFCDSAMITLPWGLKPDPVGFPTLERGDGTMIPVTLKPYTPLQHACYNGCVAMAQELIDAEVDVNFFYDANVPMRDEIYLPALLLALLSPTATGQDKSIVLKSMIAAGADCDEALYHLTDILLTGKTSSPGTPRDFKWHPVFTEAIRFLVQSDSGASFNVAPHNDYGNDLLKVTCTLDAPPADLRFLVYSGASTQPSLIPTVKQAGKVVDLSKAIVLRNTAVTEILTLPHLEFLSELPRELLRLIVSYQDLGLENLTPEQWKMVREWCLKMEEEQLPKIKIELESS